MACSRARSRDRAFGLHHQPAGAEQRVAGRPRRARTAARTASRNRTCRRRTAPFSTLMPWMSPPRIRPWQNAASVEPPANAKVQYFLLVSATVRNSNATPRKTSAEQHHDHRQIERRHDHRIGVRKRDPQSAAAEHQPGFVAVPERRDRVDHLVLFLLLLGEGEQDADAEIEAVEDDVERDGGADQAGPDDREIPFHRQPPDALRARRRCAAASGPARRVVPAARSPGPAGRARSGG